MTDDWAANAACRGADLSLFFPEQSEPVNPIAKATCARCLVADACLADAMERGHQGVWAGTTEAERASRRRREQRRERRPA